MTDTMIRTHDSTGQFLAGQRTSEYHCSLWKPLNPSLQPSRGAVEQPEPGSHLRHNFTVNLLNSSFLTFGTSLISSGVILPLFISNLSSSKMLIGLLMTISFAGWLVPQLFTAPLVARFHSIKKFLVPAVLLAERLPLLLLGPAMLLLLPAHPQWALVVFFVLLAWNYFGSGFTAVGVQELYARIIPVDKRGRLSGITGAIGIGLALSGIAVNRTVLDKLAFPYGYAILFCLAGVSGLIAWFWLLKIREPVDQELPTPEGFRSFFKKIPGVLAQDRNFTRFLIAMAVLYFGGMSGQFPGSRGKRTMGAARKHHRYLSGRHVYRPGIRESGLRLDRGPAGI